MTFVDAMHSCKPTESAKKETKATPKPAESSEDDKKKQEKIKLLTKRMLELGFPQY